MRQCFSLNGQHFIAAWTDDPTAGTLLYFCDEDGTVTDDVEALSSPGHDVGRAIAVLRDRMGLASGVPALT